MKLHPKGKKCIWWQVKIRWWGEERVRVQVLIKQKKTCACFVCTMPCIASDQTTGVHLNLSTEPVLQHHSGSRKALSAGTEDLAVGLEEGLQLPGRGVGQLLPSPSPSSPLGQANLTCGGLFSDPAQPQTAVSTKRTGGGGHHRFAASGMARFATASTWCAAIPRKAGRKAGSRKASCSSICTGMHAAQTQKFWLQNPQT